MKCEQCNDALAEYPMIIELYRHGKIHNFCCDDCASEWLYEGSNAMEVDNPDYVEEDE